VHLGAVMALFATLPYGKFAHGVYRWRGAAEVGQSSAGSEPFTANRSGMLALIERDPHGR
jgi:hypothetical protein